MLYLLSCIVVTYIIATCMLNISFIRKQDVDNNRKIIAFLVDLMHVTIVYLPIVLMLYIFYMIIFNIDRIEIVKYLLVLNIIYMIVVFCFFVFGMCILTIIYNKLLKLPVCTPFKGFLLDRLFPPDISEYMNNNNNCIVNNRAWMNSQKYVVFGLVLSNIIVLIYYIKSFKLKNKILF